ncbi:polyprenyl synthetase family protein [Lysinibacillus endophyticus]|uniref:Farnesyl diphosphate synthase n=1 Tax=Ureibacillus endophyticus TaxID=1978490 RepID=A0A494Z0I0_9BACL|nr:farnesyl diphosphate synthase [Lysinibacillus endophyticus]MCP1145183.1 polyprenyl synthetase family protein [Lysinibacillus endophyticus]RKQ15953.1 polyprenyl synthetase family protein [Lysinibacillus endophyticus]
MNLKQFIDENLPKLDEVLYELVRTIKAPAQLKESMLYSLEAGGKRIRPLFVLAVCDLFHNKKNEAYVVGAAVEMIHTYSLIHDDLPSMDNDDMRRGKPTNHVIFGDALATLAGDALNTLSFGVLARMENVSSEKKIELINLLSVAAGAEGMVGGQVLDIDGENRSLSLPELENVHINKTGALLRFSIESGAILSDATTEERSALVEYAHHIGLAFQIQDDILDIVGTTEELGKTAGKDVESHKSTYPALLTLEGAKQKLEEHYDYAITALRKIDKNTAILEEFAQYIVKRHN